MKAERDASPPGHFPLGRRTRASILAAAVRRIPQRLRQRRFWEVQALVLLITALHGVLEATDALGQNEALSFVPVSFYFIPVVYAGLNFGMEGAVPTALWSAALAVPNVLTWHSGLQRLGELLQLGIMIGVAVVVARRVDEETTQRRRAERTSASLGLLNEVGGMLSHTLEVEKQLPEVLRLLQTGLSLESVSLNLEPEHERGGPILMASPPASVGGERSQPAGGAEDNARTLEGRILTVPLLGETGLLGSLHATPVTGESLTDPQAELIGTVAQQVRVAIENARLYRQRQESLQSYARQVTQAQEDERMRIARELHDETAQELVLLSRKLEELKDRVGPDKEPEIESLLTMTRRTIQAVRRYSRDLRPSILDDLGLRAAMEMVVEETGQRLEKGAHLLVSGNERRLEGQVELALFRIAQEALRNVEKHSTAATATVALKFDPKEITLAVADDGSGFSAARSVTDLIRNGKLGLVGMKERAELVGGSFEINSSPGAGTQITVKVRAVE